MPELNVPLLRRILVALWAPLLAMPLTAGAAPPGSDPAAPAAVSPTVAAPVAPAVSQAAPGAPAAAPASPRSSVPSVTDSAAPAATSPDAGAPAARPRAAKHASRAHRRTAAAAAPESGAGATVALTTQPGSALETTATRLVAGDLKQSRSAGDPPVMLVGSARLSVKPGPSALFVQVQSADFCGSAGCSTSAYLKSGDDTWTKVLDSISGPIKVSGRSHHGMFDLLIHGKDRWVWNGTSYADTLPSPDVDLLHSVKK